MQALAIILTCILAAVGYGIVHDQVTARVCVEYFTIGHPPIFGTDDPTLLGIGWGIVATWWVGLLLGVPLAIVARAGPWPKRSPRSLVRPIAWLMAVSAICALIAGVVGWLLACNGYLALTTPIAYEVPVARHARYFADGCAHLTSYAVGFVGGIVVMVVVGRSRGASVPSGVPGYSLPRRRR